MAAVLVREAYALLLSWHKGVRDRLNFKLSDVRDYRNIKLNRAVKRFPRSQTRAAAESIEPYFRLLSRRLSARRRARLSSVA